MAYFIDSDSGLLEVTEEEWKSHSGSKYGKGLHRYTREGGVEAEYNAELLITESLHLINEARIARDTGRFEPIEVGGRTFDGFAVAQENIRGAIEEFATLDELGGSSGSISWTLADNTITTVTLADLKEVRKQFVLRYAQLHADYTAAKGQ